MERADVIIIGAGMAGLTAAEQISAKGVSVIVLEARPRVGGRIHTIHRDAAGRPVIELGAEFIHGAKNQVWALLEKTALRTDEVPDRHWRIENGRLEERNQFWEELERIFSKIDERGKDMDFETFLQKHTRPSSEERNLARLYVEGFHAAHANRISVQAIAKSEAAAEGAEGTRQFRIAEGYSKVIEFLAA